MSFNEEAYEDVIIELFKNELGYDYVHGADISRDYEDVVLVDELVGQLQVINRGVSPLAIDEAVRKVLDIPSNNVIRSNKEFHKFLTEGIDVNYYDGGNKSDNIRLIDYDNLANNSFLVVNQFTVHGNANKRPDIVVFVNGLPLTIIELKSSIREDATTYDGYLQVRNYQRAIPKLFAYNSFIVVSDLVDTRSGTITSDFDRFTKWKSVDGNSVVNDVSLETPFLGMFDKTRFLDIVKNFVLFTTKEDKDVKVLAGYHQYYAVNKAVDRTVEAVFENKDGRAGVFWHTQGSGKSLSMVFYVQKLLMPLKNPTIVVVTDRNDLDGQLCGTFTRAKSHLRQDSIIQAESRKDLRALLEGRNAGGIIFTTIQKFEEGFGVLSDRSNIVVIADEAHRSQYGENVKIDYDTGSKSYGMAKYMRDSMPNAAFIGFTGTPIDTKDKSTQNVFGDYIDIYDMTQAVEDGATKAIYYEPRVMKLGLDPNVLEAIDEEYEIIAEEAEEYHVEQSKRKVGNMEALLGADETVETLCKDILRHYDDRKHIVAGKAMIVAYSRKIAMSIYNKILELDSSFENKIAVVMTSNNQDPEEWFDVIGNKKHKSDIETKFKDASSELKIVIVVDMWLTGFDVPCLDTMYLYKPMAGHNLMQAITRVNRVYGEKDGGLIVDYVGIASSLKQAMKDFTQRDKDNFADNDVKKTALIKFNEIMSILEGDFHGFDYSEFMYGSNSTRASLIANGINFIASDEETRKEFINDATKLKQAESLCRSLLDEETKLVSSFFYAVRAGLVKLSQSGKLSPREINERISELLHASIKSEGVVKVFDDTKPVSIFDEKYIEAISKMEQKNLAVELLKKLLADELKVFKRTNLVKSELFSERMQKILNQYKNAQITNAEVIEQLMGLVDDIKASNEEGKDLGLTKDEQAFYDALSTPEGVKEAYNNEQFLEMTKALTEQIQKNKTIDWSIKKSAQAGMRSMIKRLLKKFDYPPKEREKAIEKVLRQAELMADNIEE